MQISMKKKIRNYGDCYAVKVKCYHFSIGFDIQEALQF